MANEMTFRCWPISACHNRLKPTQSCPLRKATIGQKRTRRNRRNHHCGLSLSQKIATYYFLPSLISGPPPSAGTVTTSLREKNLSRQIHIWRCFEAGRLIARFLMVFEWHSRKADLQAYRRGSKQAPTRCPDPMLRAGDFRLVHCICQQGCKGAQCKQNPMPYR